ncbi:hypothetical protein [Wolbachia endosymbiont (group A) of Lasioglossum fulvicorne]|uniref:hypothetical protein n=1 Tax=Wolbachia endosymbiont (group A) of Lasioglossum fulvicorne TaxID=3066201 RepID=UPI0033402653
MTANMEFKDAEGRYISQVSGLNNIKIMTLRDKGGNEYTLDVGGDDLKLKYRPSGEDEVEYKVDGLAEAMKSLLDVRSSSGKTVLAEKVAEKPIVEEIFFAKDEDGSRISDTILTRTFARKDDTYRYMTRNLQKKANADNVYTKEDIDKKLAIKADIGDVYTTLAIDHKLEAKADSSVTYTKEEVNQRFFPVGESQKLAKEVLRKRVGGKSILVDELGRIFDDEELWYGNENGQTAKDFLAEKGNFAKADGSNIKVLEFTKKILGATEDIGEGKKKSILVEKLGGFLDQTADNENAYDGKIAKAFLGDKGMQGLKGADGAQGPAGKDGKSPSIEEVAVQLLTDENKDILGKTVLDITDSTGQNLATHVASKINLNSQDFINKADPIKLAELLFNKSNVDQLEAKKIAKDKVSPYKISELVFNDAKNALVENHQWDRESFIEDVIEKASTSRLAELLFDAGGIEKGEAKRITEGKVNPEKLAEYLFNASGLGNNIDESKMVVNNVTQHLLNTKADEIGKAVVNDNENREILAGSRTLQEGVAEKLRENPGKTRGIKGDPGQRGEVGQDGKSPAPDAVAQELISSNAAELVQAILNVKGKFDNDVKPALETYLVNNSSFQKAVAGDQDLRTTVITNLIENRDFCNVVKRDAGGLSIDNQPFFEISNDPNDPLSCDW